MIIHAEDKDACIFILEHQREQLNAKVKKLEEALRVARDTVDAMLVLYTQDECDPQSVDKAKRTVGGSGGTIAFCSSTLDIINTILKETHEITTMDH